jgi:hypothetical protein
VEIISSNSNNSVMKQIIRHLRVDSASLDVPGLSLISLFAVSRARQPARC